MSAKANIDNEDTSRNYLFDVFNKNQSIYFASHTCFSSIDIFLNFNDIPTLETFYKKLIYDVYYSKLQTTIDNA